MNLKGGETDRSSFHIVFSGSAVRVCCLPVESQTHAPLADYQLLGEKNWDQDTCFFSLSTTGRCANKQTHISIPEIFCAFPPYGACMNAQIKLGARDLLFNWQIRDAHLYELAKITTRTLYIWYIPSHLYFKSVVYQ